MPAFQIDYGQHGGLRLSGELDLSTAPQLCDALLPMVVNGGDVVVDLAAVPFMDWPGLPPLVLAAHLLAGRGRGGLRPGGSSGVRVRRDGRRRRHPWMRRSPVRPAYPHPRVGAHGAAMIRCPTCASVRVVIKVPEHGGLCIDCGTWIRRGLPRR